MTQRQNRRKFMKVSAAASAGFWAAGGVSAKASTSAIETINFACVSGTVHVVACCRHRTSTS